MTIQTAIRVKLEAVLPCGNALEDVGNASVTLQAMKELLAEKGFERVEISSKLTNINVRSNEDAADDAVPGGL